MAVKYQVFISSTYEDLKAEREKVTRAILEMGHIPVGMEMFSAADEEQWQIIARHIDESDYYVVIVAHRYGSMTEGVSYTRKEYEYAIARGIPVLGFIIDEDAKWPASYIDSDPDSIARLNEFKSLVRLKPVDFWSSTEELYSRCAVALMKTFTTRPREGWVRASSTAGPEITAELSRLSAENAQLRAAAVIADDAAKSAYSTRLQETKELLRNDHVSVSYRYAEGDKSWQHDADEISYLTIFAILAPSLQVEYDVDAISSLLALHVRSDEERRADIVPMNFVKQYLGRLRAFDLVEPSTRRHSVSNTKEYWSLTAFGQDLLAELLGNDLSRSAANDEPGVGPKKAPAKKGPAKKAPAKKTASKRAPAKKAPAKKTASKKAPMGGSASSHGVDA